jgi:hypothetical protein
MKRFPFYPFFVCLFVLFALYSTNFDQAKFREMWFPFAFTLGMTAVLLWLISIPMRSVHRAGVVVAAFLMLFLSYGQWIDLIWYWWPPELSDEVFRDRLNVYLVQFVVLSVVVYQAWKIKDARAITAPLNYLGLFLAICPIGATLWKQAEYE